MEIDFVPLNRGMCSFLRHEMNASLHLPLQMFLAVDVTVTKSLKGKERDKC